MRILSVSRPSDCFLRKLGSEISGIRKERSQILAKQMTQTGACVGMRGREGGFNLRLEEEEAMVKSSTNRADG